ncbi:MAG: response regulator [Anaerolineae bacterium]
MSRPSRSTAPHILILDADATSAQVTRAGLERALPGVTLAVETNPECGWLSMKHHRPDVLIIDPAPYGLASAWLIQALKGQCVHACVIVLASARTPGLRRDLQRLRVDAYVEKPASLAEIIAIVNAALPSTDGCANAN